MYSLVENKRLSGISFPLPNKVSKLESFQIVLFEFRISSKNVQNWAFKESNGSSSSKRLQLYF